MDVDITEQLMEDTTTGPESSAKADGKKPMTVPVDDAHPFELDVYASSYSGRSAVIRLLHIMQHCPTLASQAFYLATQRIRRTRDPTLYQSAVSIHNSLPGVTEPAAVDQKWMEEVQVKNQSERNKLEVELKTYQSNMIKESIRMAHRDLADFYRAAGDDAGSLKHYTKSREFCSTSQHVLDMCISVLELLIDQRNYAHISTYTFKAESALEVATSSSAKDNSATTGSSAAAPTQLHKKTAPSAERERVQTKLDLANALSHMGQGGYERAALVFLKMGNPKGLEDWNGKIITPSDIAIYGTLCALATLSRGAIKARILENETFGIYLEQEPYVRELVEAYMGSKFKTVLDLMERHSSRHYLDVHLFPHVQELTNLIRNRALVLYFQPFASIKLPRMASAFGLGVEDLEKLVVALIQSGDIKGRVDSQNKILKAKETDQRAALFARAVNTGAEIQSTNRKLLLRMKLQQADLVVKNPKVHQGPQVHPSEILLSD